MIKTILIAIWACVVALGANFGYGWYKARQANAASGQEAKAALEVRKLKEISVPTIRDGAVKGYIVVKLNYLSDSAKTASLGYSADAFIADEVFTYLYSEQSIDYNKLERYDISKFKAAVQKRTNERIGADVVSDIAMQEFSFMRASDLSRGEQ